MNLQELTDLLVTSSQQVNRSKFIPWWEDSFEDSTYRYDILKPEVVQESEACLATCSRDMLLAPVGSYGLTLLHLLVWHSFHDILKEIFQRGTLTQKDVNQPDHKGYGLTPFLLSCCRGNLSMATLLLDQGADPARCDSHGRNAYHFLAGARIPELATSYSCTTKSMAQRASIARLLDIDVNQKDEEGFTPLVCMLCSSSHSSYSYTLTELFLEKGADTSYMDDNGNTLLLLALKNNHITAALQLMTHCPELVNVPDREGTTPFQQVSGWNNEGLCMALADHGASSPDTRPLPLSELSRITSNAFGMASEEEPDGITLALYLTEKLIRQIDPDDDDELGYITGILHNALVSDKSYRVLDVCQKEGLDFTAPIHFHGSVTCLRDECLGISYGTGAIRRMLTLGVDMDTSVIKGRTPAYLVASRERPNAIFRKYDSFFEEAAGLFSRESMEQTDQGGKAAIHMAAIHGHTDMLRVMLEKGVDINLTEDMPAEAGTTPLHEACIHGHGDVVKLLMEAGADDTLQNAAGETPAHVALRKTTCNKSLEPARRAEILQALKHLDLAREDGKTPLMLLQYLDINTVIGLLPLFLDRGVHVNATDQGGRSALLLHTDLICHKDTVKELLKAGADVNLADNQGNTALHYSLLYGNVDVARFLIRKGADYNRPDNHGRTPVQIAVEKGYDTVLELMADIR